MDTRFGTAIGKVSPKIFLVQRAGCSARYNRQENGEQLTTKSWG